MDTKIIADLLNQITEKNVRDVASVIQDALLDNELTLETPVSVDDACAHLANPSDVAFSVIYAISNKKNRDVKSEFVRLPHYGPATCFAISVEYDRETATATVVIEHEKAPARTYDGMVESPQLARGEDIRELVLDTLDIARLVLVVNTQ